MLHDSTVFRLQFLNGSSGAVEPWVWIAVELLPFAALYLIYWYLSREQARRVLFKFALFAAANLLLDPFGSLGFLGPLVLSRVGSHSLPPTVARLVLASRGWFLPVVLLALFTSFLLYRYKHLHPR